MNATKTLDYYLSLPYHFEMVREDDETWFARVRELPGCVTEADTPEEAARMIREAMTGWIEIALEDGHEVPEPKPEEQYSGRFLVRLPKSLHRALAVHAEAEGVSLNQFVTVSLARAVGDPDSERLRRPSDARRVSYQRQAPTDAGRRARILAEKD